MRMRVQALVPAACRERHACASVGCVPNGEAWVGRRAASWQAVADQHQHRPRPAPRATPHESNTQHTSAPSTQQLLQQQRVQVRVDHVPVHLDAQRASDRLIQPRSAGARNTRGDAINLPVLSCRLAEYTLPAGSPAAPCGSALRSSAPLGLISQTLQGVRSEL
jgi:hypothetical protein